MVDLHKNISSYTDTMIKKEKVLVALFGIIFLGLVKTQASVLTGVEPTYINVGSGSDLSYLAIDESDLYTTPLVFVYHYDYDSNNPLTGFSLLTNVAAGSVLFPATSFYPNYGNSLDSLTYAGGTVITATNASDFSVGTYWSYYLSGGLDGGVLPDLTGQWNYANYGMDSRTVTPGSWDGWSFTSYTDYGLTTSDASPSVAINAVPEPSPTHLVLLSLVSVFFLNRWRQSKGFLPA